MNPLRLDALSTAEILKLVAPRELAKRIGRLARRRVLRH
jgi:hypothetical protein